jgi:hypothetical protein
MRRRCRVSSDNCRYAAATAKKARRRKTSREKNMAFHQVKELGWVSFWVAFIIALFAFFIPTVNRALNL